MGSRQSIIQVYFFEADCSLLNAWCKCEIQPSFLFPWCPSAWLGSRTWALGPLLPPPGWETKSQLLWVSVSWVSPRSRENHRDSGITYKFHNLFSLFQSLLSFPCPTQVSEQESSLTRRKEAHSEANFSFLFHSDSSFGPTAQDQLTAVPTLISNLHRTSDKLLIRQWTDHSWPGIQLWTNQLQPGVGIIWYQWWPQRPYPKNWGTVGFSGNHTLL